MRSAPLSTRSRIIEHGPIDAIKTRYDLFEPLEMATSEHGKDYLAGRVKVVANSFRANGRMIHMSYSIIWAPAAEHSFCASLHRQRVREDIQKRYKDTIARAIPHTNPKTLKRRRHRMNADLGTDAPELDATDAYFSAHPEAIAAGAPLRVLWQTLGLGLG